MSDLIYLAQAYSHPDEDIRHQRFEQGILATGYLMNQGYLVFAPIVSSHPVAVSCNLPKGFDYWESLDRRMISHCDMLYILLIDGWMESIGVNAEIKIALELGKPIFHMNPVDDVYEIDLA